MEEIFGDPCVCSRELFFILSNEIYERLEKGVMLAK